MWLCIIDLPSHSHLLVSCSLNHPGAEPATKHVCELLPAVCRVGPVQTLLPTSHSELGQSRNLPPAADISQNTSSLAVSAMPSVYRYSSHWDKYHHKHCNYSTNTSPAPTPVRVFGPNHEACEPHSDLVGIIQSLVLRITGMASPRQTRQYFVPFPRFYFYLQHKIYEIVNWLKKDFNGDSSSQWLKIFLLTFKLGSVQCSF